MIDDALTKQGETRTHIPHTRKLRALPDIHWKADSTRSTLRAARCLDEREEALQDDDLLFPGAAPDNDADGEATDDRASHVELTELGPPTRRETPAAGSYLARVPVLAVSEAELTLLPLDHREGFLVSHIDGASSIETILDVCAMPADEALMLIEGLVERGVIVVR